MGLGPELEAGLRQGLDLEIGVRLGLVPRMGFGSG